MASAGVECQGRRAPCILHNGSNPTALAIFDDGTRWKCFSCGMGGDAIDWLVAVEQITKIEAVARLLGVDPSGSPRPCTAVTEPRPSPNLPAEPKRRPWHDLAWQEVGWIVNVLTMGGASQTPAPDAKALLSACPVLALLFDHDPNMAGDRAAWKFAAAVPTRSCRLRLPGANDLNAFYREGGNVVAWLKTEFDRLDWRWPAAVRLEGR
jgi:hypothetical protein